MSLKELNGLHIEHTDTIPFDHVPGLDGECVDNWRTHRRDFGLVLDYNEAVFGRSAYQNIDGSKVLSCGTSKSDAWARFTWPDGLTTTIWACDTWAALEGLRYWALDQIKLHSPRFVPDHLPPMVGNP